MTYSEPHGHVCVWVGGCLAQEYGITNEEKRTIGSRICHHLLRKIMFDLSAVRCIVVCVCALYVVFIVWCAVRCVCGVHGVCMCGVCTCDVVQCGMVR